jgi:hypothetical protein
MGFSIMTVTGALTGSSSEVDGKRIKEVAVRSIHRSLRSFAASHEDTAWC